MFGAADRRRCPLPPPPLAADVDGSTAVPPLPPLQADGDSRRFVLPMDTGMPAKSVWPELVRGRSGGHGGGVSGRLRQAPAPGGGGKPEQLLPRTRLSSPRTWLSSPSHLSEILPPLSLLAGWHAVRAGTCRHRGSHASRRPGAGGARAFHGDDGLPQQPSAHLLRPGNGAGGDAAACRLRQPQPRDSSRPCLPAGRMLGLGGPGGDPVFSHSACTWKCP